MRWTDYDQIGAALDRAHPDVNYMTVSNSRLRNLVVGLAGFVDAGNPPADADLAAIRFAWTAVAEGEDDDSPHSAAG